MDALNYTNFLIAAVVLLASPGPAYAMVVAIGRSGGWRAGQKFNVGLQFGMAAVAAFTAFGLAAVLILYPSARTTLGVLGAAYLLFLAFKIASAPVGTRSERSMFPVSFGAGFLVGVTNPKAYAAQGSLFASFELLPQNAAFDGGIKWFSAVLIMTLAGLAWLWVGAKLGQLAMSPRTERAINLTFATAIVAAGSASLVM